MARSDDRAPIDDVRDMVRDGIQDLTREPVDDGEAAEPERPEPVEEAAAGGRPDSLVREGPSVDDGGAGAGAPLEGVASPGLGGAGRGPAPDVAADPGVGPDVAPSLDGATSDQGAGPDWSDPDVQESLTFATQYLESQGIDTSEMSAEQIATEFRSLVDAAELELYGEMAEAYLVAEGVATEGMSDQELVDAAVDHADQAQHDLIIEQAKAILEDAGVPTDGLTDQQILDRTTEHLQAQEGNTVPLIEGSIGRAIDAVLSGDAASFGVALDELGSATETTLFELTEALNEIIAEVEAEVDEALAPDPPADDEPDTEPDESDPDEPDQDEPDQDESDEDTDADADDGDADEDADDTSGGEQDEDESDTDSDADADADTEGEGEEPPPDDGAGQPAEPGGPEAVPGYTPDDLRESLEESTRYTEVTLGAERDAEVQYADTPGQETGGTPSAKPHPNPVDPADPVYGEHEAAAPEAVRSKVGGNVDPHDDPSGSAGGAPTGAPGGPPVRPGGNPVADEQAFGRGELGAPGSAAPPAATDADLVAEQAGLGPGADALVPDAAGAVDGGLLDAEVDVDITAEPAHGGPAGLEVEAEVDDPSDLGPGAEEAL